MLVKTCGVESLTAFDGVAHDRVQGVAAGGRLLHQMPTLERREGAVVFSVTDRGPGIPAEISERVFDRFESHALGSEHRGVGLGLSIVRSFVELHGGTVKLDSAVGRGTTVTCIFPLKRVPQEAAAADEAGAKRSEYGLGIYVHHRRDGGVNLWHTGSLPGTSAIAVRTVDGFAWVAVFNGRPEGRNNWRSEVDRGLWTAKSQVRKWPDGDLFR